MSEPQSDERVSTGKEFWESHREGLTILARRFAIIFLTMFLLAAWFQWRSSGQTPRASFRFEKRENPFRHDISADGRFAFTWTNFPDMETPRFRVWDANSRGTLQELWSATFGESDVVVPSPDLSTLAFFDAYPQPKLLLLNAADGKPLAEWVSPHQPTQDSMIPVAHQVTWSPTGTRIAVWGNDYSRLNQVYVLSIPDLTLELELPLSTRPVFTPDGDLVIAQQLERPTKESEQGYAMYYQPLGWSIWNLRTKRKQSFLKESAKGELVLPARDAMTLVIGDNPDDSGSHVPGVRLIDPLSGESIAAFPESRLSALSADGNWILTSEGDGIPVVRDALTGVERWRGQARQFLLHQVFPGHNANFPFVGLVDASPDARRLTLRTLDEGRLVQRLPPGQSGHLKFSANFNRMAEMIRRHDPGASWKGKRIAVFDLPPRTDWPSLLFWSLSIALGTALIVEVAWQIFVWRMDGDPLFPGWE